MKPIISSIDSSIESISKLIRGFIGLCICIGCLIVIFYSIRIGSFPQGVSLGDGLLFLMAAGCFGVIYATFIGCMTSLGVMLSPVLKLILWCVRKAFRHNKKLESCFKKLDSYSLAQFSLWSVPFGLLALLIIITFARYNPDIYLNLFLLALLLYFSYSVVLYTGERYWEAVKLSLNIRSETPEKPVSLNDCNEHKFVFLTSIICFVFIPLIFGGVTGQLLDNSMRLVKLRIDSPILYVKMPYSNLLPESLLAKDAAVMSDFIAFEGITVLFRGVGNVTTVIFKDGEYTRQLGIPNDQVIIERKKNSQSEPS